MMKRGRLLASGLDAESPEPNFPRFIVIFNSDKSS